MKAVVKNISYSSARGQELILVLQALWDLQGRNSKRETIEHINRAGYFDVTRHDLPPYVGQSEPKCHTLLAWARKDGAIKEWVFDDERDSWGITRQGREILENAKAKFESRKWAVSECYLWTPNFKRLMDPGYIPSDRDRKRPEDEWEEMIRNLCKPD